MKRAHTTSQGLFDLNDAWQDFEPVLRQDLRRPREDVWPACQWTGASAYRDRVVLILLGKRVSWEDKYHHVNHRLG